MAHLHRSYDRPDTVAGSTTEPYPVNRTEAGDTYVTDEEAWLARSRVVLTPLAAPSILGLFGFFAATIAVGTNIAGWWGGSTSGLTLFPFALVLGGLAQFLAGMWSYRARDGLATAMHGTWGSFWMAWGVLQLLYATGVETAVPLGTTDRAFAWWFIPLCAITASGALTAMTQNLGLFAVLAALAGGCGIFAAGLYSGNLTVDHVAGWFFIVSAAVAWYVATAMMMLGTTGRTVLPIGEYSKAANVPMGRPRHPLEYTLGEPGVRAGQ